MTRALLLLDLQNEMVHSNGKVGASGLAAVVQQRGVLRNAETVLHHARNKGWKIAHIRLGFRADYEDCLSVAPRIQKLKDNQAALHGEWGTEFPAELTPTEGELVVTKQCVNPFFNTILMTWLLQHGVKELFMGGVATNLVVEATARAADDAGFKVNVIEDLCAGPNPDWHEFSVRNIMPMFGTVTSSQSVIAAA